MNALLSTTLFDDFRFALRHMRRSPGFAITAVLILALGIGANVIVFGVLDALVLRPLDVPQPEQMRTLTHRDQNYPIFSLPEVRDVRDDNSVFSSVAAWTMANLGLEANGATRPVWAFLVSGQYFEVVGVKPYLGRLLQRSDDDHPGASDVAVLSWSAWKGDFGADPNIVGKTVRLSKHPYTIVGVAPQGFYGTERFLQADFFVPMANEASLLVDNFLEVRQHPTVFSVVRIKDGVTPAQVQANLDTVASRITRQYPKEEEKLALKVVLPGLVGDFFGAPARGFLAGVMGLAGIVLLAACANIGSLFAARTADRAREIAIRLAVGSSRWRVVRQVLMEACLLAGLGGVGAGALAWLALSGLATWQISGEVPIRFHILPQPSLFLIALLIALIAGLLFGMMPLRQIFKADPNDAIKSGGSQPVAGHGFFRNWALRDLLLAAQIALCCITVTAAFVALRGLNKSLTMELGFNPKNAVVTKFDLDEAGYVGEAAQHFQRQLLEKVAQLPGVEAAGYANVTPLINAANSAVFTQQTSDFRPSNKAFDKYDYAVSPGYFAAAGTPLLAGRDVSFSDTAKTPAVAVVNQEFARRLLGSGTGTSIGTSQAVGRYYRDKSGSAVQIVGIVGDGKNISLSEDPQAAAFLPILQSPGTEMALVVRVGGTGKAQSSRSQSSPSQMAATIRKVIHDLDPGVPIQESSEWTDQLGMSFFPARVATIALGIFGAFGLLLSITGTFGLASYTVSKRLRELSIRVALGARTKQVLSAALGRMLVLLASGSVVGILLGAATSKVLSYIVYQATAMDPFVLGAVALTVLLTGLLSVTGPVRRALRVDPALLLREQ